MKKRGKYKVKSEPLPPPVVLGSGTTEDPFHYIVDQALIDAVKNGRWSVLMLADLAKFAEEHLACEEGR